MKTPNSDNLILIEDDGKDKTSELIELVDPYWCYWDMDELDKLIPTPKTPTSRYFKNEQENDSITRDISADELPKGEYMNFREWLIFESLWFKKQGTHLDDWGVTMFPDNRVPGGVVRAYWGPGGRRVWVGWGKPGLSDPLLGARPAVVVEKEVRDSSLDSSFDFSHLEQRVKALEDKWSKLIKVLKA